MNILNEIEKLNEKQKEVFNKILSGGYLLASAVPGSGKTKTITISVCGLIEKNIPANEIFVSTFTKKAANEMKERIYKIIGEKSKDINIHTFHAFCYQMLKKYAPIYGYHRYKDFDLLDDEVQKFTFKKIFWSVINNFLEIEKISEEDGAKYYSKDEEAINKINNLKTENISFSKFAKKNFVVGSSSMTFENIVSYCWIKYEQYKKEKNLLDFNDILIHMNDILEDEKFRKAVQRFTKYVIIDEFQDTNNLQMSIVNKLTQGNLACLGDENQSIYKFRKANIELIKNFAKTYSAEVINMNINYRSHSVITNSATELINNNDSIKDNKIINFFPIPENYTCDFKEFNSYIEEAEWIADFIASKKEELGTIGVIYRNNFRNNFIGEEIGCQLKKIGIFYGRKEEFNIFQRIEVKLL